MVPVNHPGSDAGKAVYVRRFSEGAGRDRDQHSGLQAADPGRKQSDSET